MPAKTMTVPPLDRIDVDPAVCQGQPTIRGTRITVGVILRMLAGGATLEDVLEAYPELEEEDVRQAMRYAAWKASEELRPTVS
jgi:uncharacterized protein (DUF433 family)